MTHFQCTKLLHILECLISRLMRFFVHPSLLSRLRRLLCDESLLFRHVDSSDRLDTRYRLIRTDAVRFYKTQGNFLPQVNGSK